MTGNETNWTEVECQIKLFLTTYNKFNMQIRKIK